MPRLYDLSTDELVAPYLGRIKQLEYDEFMFNLTKVKGGVYYFNIPEDFFHANVPWTLVDFDNNIQEKTPVSIKKFAYGTWMILGSRAGQMLYRSLENKKPKKETEQDIMDDIANRIKMSGLPKDEQEKLMRELESI